jgi:hypothetical protein
MATTVSHRLPTAQAHASTDRPGAAIVYLTGTETLQELRQRGLPDSTAHAARKRGYYCPQYNRRLYPQHEGLGGFADLYEPQGFVVNQLAQALRKADAHLDPETFREWTQELLLECWKRRHAPHVTRFVPYYQVMIRGLVRQWLQRKARQEALEAPTPRRRRHPRGV